MRIHRLLPLLVVAPMLYAQAPKSLAERLGHPANARLLIIETDIGMMHSINRAAFEALEKGWVTSATVLVPCPWFPEAARFARAHPEGDYGVHLALNSEWVPYRWGPVTPRALVPSLLDAGGYFPPLETGVVRQAKPDEVERELRAQIEKARAAGINVTHLDSHMGTLFASPQLFAIYQRLGHEYGLPILIPRTHALAKAVPANVVLIDRELTMRPGVPSGQWLETYEKMLAPLGPGVYQLTVHLGYDDEEARAATEGRNWGAAWRQNDFDVVRTPQFQQFLRDQGFVLVRWKELQRVVGR